MNVWRTSRRKSNNEINSEDPFAVGALLGICAAVSLVSTGAIISLATWDSNYFYRLASCGAATVILMPAYGLTASLGDQDSL